MLAWTIQPLTIMQDIEQYGTFRCDPSRSFNLSKTNSLKPAYRWLMREMRERIGAAPEGVVYPIWAWHTWEGEHKAPDPDSAAFLQRTEDKVYLTLDLPEDHAILTDYEKWQSVMMNTFLFWGRTEEEVQQQIDEADSLEGEVLETAMQKSWQNVFQLADAHYIQATFWEIRREYIVDAKILRVNAD
jgi:hypothetical protein